MKMKPLSKIILIVLSAAQLAGFQSPGFSQTTPTGQLDWLKMASHSFEGAISPTAYLLGPGDVLVYALWGQKNVTYTLPVTPQGKLMVPDVGGFDVAGKSLAKVKGLLDAAAQKVFSPDSTSLSLKSVRSFRVFVTGAVAHPGMVISTPLDRVSLAIRNAGGLLKNASRRSIELRREHGKTLPVDLLAYRRLGKLEANPFLRDGDVVWVPVARSRVAVTGAVLWSSEFEIRPHESVRDAIALAGGLAPNARADSIVLARFAPDNRTIRRICVTAVNPNAPNFWGKVLVQPDDRLLVHARNLYRQKRQVEIWGEVRFPGVYAINENEWRLTDLIRQAGGFTDEASLVEARLIRRSGEDKKDPEFERLKKMQPSEMTEMEYEYFKLKSREMPGRMSVDFVRLFVQGDSSQNVVLKNGDVVTIPKKKTFVQVAGQVLYPGNVKFHPHWKVKDYIRFAGGFNWNARKGKMRIIRAKTGEWMKVSQVRFLEPGDVIWVPEKPVRDYWKIFREFMLAASQAATVYLVVRNAMGR